MVYVFFGKVFWVVENKYSDLGGLDGSKLEVGKGIGGYRELIRFSFYFNLEVVFSGMRIKILSNVDKVIK